MMTPDAPVKLHRILNDQLYHYYLGDPIEVRLMYENGTTERVAIGPDVLGGQHVQFFIPGGTFHTARIAGQRRWFLGGSTEWPGVDPTLDVELGNAGTLAAKYPEAACRHPRVPSAAIAHLRLSPRPQLSALLMLQGSWDRVRTRYLSLAVLW